MARKIRQAAVIGSGIMGGGIAALLAGAGVKVLLLDIVPFDLKDEEKNDLTARNRIVKAGLDAALASSPSLFFNKKDAGLITIGNLEDDIDKLADCDWIVEVVVERLGIKRSLFEKVAKIRKPGSIVTTNTSGIPLKDITDGFSAEFRQHFMGTHFFNPVRYMHLLELIPGEDTLPEILDFVAKFGEKNLGKGIVWAKDTPKLRGQPHRHPGHQRGHAIHAGRRPDRTGSGCHFRPGHGTAQNRHLQTTDLVGLDIMMHVAKNSYDLCKEDEQRDIMQLPDFVEKWRKKTAG